MTWATATGTPAERIRAAHDGAVQDQGVMVTIRRNTRARTPGDGYLKKDRQTLGPVRVHVYFQGNSNRPRGDNGDDAGRQDRNDTWSASFLSSDTTVLAPLTKGAAPGEWEFEHPVYGRFRLERINPMQYQGNLLGYQAGVVRVGYEVPQELQHQNVQGGVYNNVRRRISATVAMVQAFSGPAESDMKANAKWIDRTANARNGLSADTWVKTSPKVTQVALVLSHGVSYGVWLELRWNGKYAIVGPTTLAYRKKVQNGIKRIWSGSQP